MRVRLFLEAFGVRAAVLNAELPLNSRHHILQASHRGVRGLVGLVVVYLWVLVCLGEGEGRGRRLAGAGVGHAPSEAAVQIDAASQLMVAGSVNREAMPREE